MEALYLNTHLQRFDEQQVQQAISLLPQWRREQAQRFRFLAGRRECALSYIELLRALRQEYGITEAPCFGYNRHGKPFLPDLPHIHFSLSHCSVAAGCLVSDKPCGMDVERIRHAKESLVRYCMCQGEVEEILASPCPDLAFTRLWTQKEAVFKLLGTGIRDNIKTILTSPEAEGVTITTVENPIDGYVVSTALWPQP